MPKAGQLLSRGKVDREQYLAEPADLAISSAFMKPFHKVEYRHGLAGN
jgi:hypothetical protein